jgi:hypothetical protein
MVKLSTETMLHCRAIGTPETVSVIAIRDPVEFDIGRIEKDYLMV